jgi:transcriptional regulator with XRE-family HTH domain
MWLDNLKELRKQKGNPTYKQIADEANLPEKTVARIFSGETDHPYMDTIQRIVSVPCLDGSLDAIFADTKVVVATETVAELQETKEVITAQNDLISVENDMLKTKVAALTTEIELLKKELEHKNELLALHNYYKTHIEQIIKRDLTLL